jgi:hypothetical protein
MLMFLKILVDVTVTPVFVVFDKIGPVFMVFDKIGPIRF